MPDTAPTGSAALGRGPAWLFCPADRPDRFAKAAAAADTVILDLEDGVAAGDRPAARRALVDHPLDPTSTVVRISATGTDDHEADLAALRTTGYLTIMLAKSEDAAAVSDLADLQVVALCETPSGVLNAQALATVPQVVALMWGAEDLVAALGGRSSRAASGGYRDLARHARAHVLLAAGAAGKVAVDAVYLDLADDAGLALEAEDAAASGFDAKACIHPRQVPTVRAGFAPDATSVGWAQRVLAAAQDRPGVFAFEGRMVDEPLIEQARQIVSAHHPA